MLEPAEDRSWSEETTAESCILRSPHVSVPGNGDTNREVGFMRVDSRYAQDVPDAPRA